MNKLTKIGVAVIAVGTILMTQLFVNHYLIVLGVVLNTLGIFLMTKGAAISSIQDKGEIIEKIKGVKEEIGLIKNDINDHDSLKKIEKIEDEFNEWAENFINNFESKRVEQQKSEILLKEKEINLSKKWRHIYQYIFEVIQQMLTAYNQKTQNKIEFILPMLPVNLFSKDVESFKSLIIYNKNTVWTITFQMIKPYRNDEIPNIVINFFYGKLGGNSVRKRSEIGYGGEFLLLDMDPEEECFNIYRTGLNQNVGEIKKRYSIKIDDYKKSIKDFFTIIIEYQIINLKR